jgi:metallo-beta-lactamase family protein
MELEFWGAARQVTGSMHLARVNGRQLLLDCGLYQGRRKHAFERNRSLPFDPGRIDAVILSHAHIDHAGNLPTLVKNGFRGRIYATPATRDLCNHMLVDSAHIQKSDVRYVNRRRRRQGKRPFEPLYLIGDARKALGRFSAVGYGRIFEPIPGVRAHFQDAGHILGSASVVLDMTEGSRTRRLVFSGDIGRRGLPILRDPRITDGADYVIMESTYGDREHAAASEARTYLKECAASTFESGGKLLIPAFALGRTQEVVYRLNQLWESGDLPAIPVFVDSPLAVNITEVYGRHPECYDAEMLETLENDSDGDPLGFRCLRYVESPDESKALNTRRGPAVIISASGMCEAGRILHHLKNHIGRSSTTILFVGYQAQHTLGRRLMDGVSPVSILGDRVEVRARVEKADSYSAHAGRSELISWAERTRDAGPVKSFFIVHGEEEAAEALGEALRRDGMAGVQVPERGQTFELA